MEACDSILGTSICRFIFCLAYNRLPENNGRDVAIVWPFEKFADLDVDDWSMSEEFDEEYGDGAWDNAIKEWRASVEGQKRQIWTRVE